MSTVDKTKDGDKDKKDADVLSASLSGASYLIVLQLFSRLLTFALNQVLLRFTSPEVLGTANVQLELLLNTILFLSREGFRSALLRTEAPKTAKDRQKVINLAYIPIPVGLITAAGACFVYLRSVEDGTRNQPFFGVSVTLYGAAAILELVVEPLYILSANSLLFRLRFATEGSAVIARCVVTVAVTLAGVEVGSRDNKYGVLAFATGQLTYGLLIAGGYIFYYLRHAGAMALIPQKLEDKDHTIWFDSKLLNMAKTFTQQSVLKQFLTEGDKFMVGFLSSRTDQGVYALVLNYGSLVARILFQPTEETERILFGKLLGGKENITKQALSTSAEILSTIVKTHFLFGLLFAAFGPSYAGTLLDLLVGSRWSLETSAPRVLGAFCVFVPFMGLNGITESFVQSVATEKDLRRQNRIMVLFSGVFCLAVMSLMKWPLQLGETGVVVANMVNLGCRVMWSRGFINEWYQRQTHGKDAKIQTMLHWKAYFPDTVVLISFLGCFVLTTWSEQVIGWRTLDQKLRHVSVGAGCIAMLLGVL